MHICMHVYVYIHMAEFLAPSLAHFIWMHRRRLLEERNAIPWIYEIPYLQAEIDWIIGNFTTNRQGRERDRL